jgi:hypothetical protein
MRISKPCDGAAIHSALTQQSALARGSARFAATLKAPPLLTGLFLSGRSFPPPKLSRRVLRDIVELSDQVGASPCSCPWFRSEKPGRSTPPAPSFCTVHQGASESKIGGQKHDELQQPHALPGVDQDQHIAHPAIERAMLIALSTAARLTVASTPVFE